MRRLAEDFHDRGDGRRAAALYETVLDQVANGGESAAWLHYLSADAHRLAGELSQAQASIGRARRLSADFTNAELLERIDMLSYYIAHDSGDCDAAVASLESFLVKHPGSGLQSQAKHTLAALRRGEGMECT